MPKYVGLTNDPSSKKIEHGNPLDWQVLHLFNNENEAREWEKMMTAGGFQGGPAGSDWKYGYTFTITDSTKQ